MATRVGAMTLLLAIAGCSPGGATSSPGGATSSPGGATSSPGGATSSPGGAKLTLSTQDFYATGQAAVMDSVYQTCGTKIGVSVSTNHVPGSGLVAKVLQQIASKTLPDVLTVDNPDLQQIAATGVLAPLSNFGITGDGFAPGVVQAGTYQGTLYGLGPAMNSIVLFYNTDTLKAAGVTPPTTWDELKAAAKTLTGPGKYGFAFSGINTFEGTWQFLPFMWTNGGDEKNIDTPQAAQALQLLVDLVNSGSASKSVVTWTQSDVLSQFISGKAAMMINGPWNLPPLLAATTVHWGTVQIPTPKAGQTAIAPLGGQSFSVPLATDKARMAKAGELLACIFSAESQTMLANANVGIPSLVAVGNQVATNNPVLASFVEVVRNARSRTAELGAGWPAAATKIYTALQLALTGKATPADALHQAQSGNQ